MTDIINIDCIDSKNITLRDLFSGMALQGEISTQKEGYVEYTDNNFDRLASYCYKIADAMLKEREIKNYSMNK